MELDEKAVLEVTRNLSNKLTGNELETTIVRLIAVKEAIEKKILRGEFAASPGEIIPDGTLSILAKHTGSEIVSLRRDLKTWGPQVAAEHKEENSYLGHVKARIEVAEGRGEDLPPSVYKQFDE